MSDKCIMVLPDNMYFTGSPIMVVSGRVVQDENTFQNKLFLNMKNLSGYTINSVILKAFLLNDNNEIMASQDIGFQGLSVLDNKNFGDDRFFILPGINFSSITLMLCQVVYLDNTPWTGNEYMLEVVPGQELVSRVFNNSKVTKKYMERFGEKANRVYSTYSDLWLCTCGSIHKNNMNFCSDCGVNRQLLENFSFEDFANEVVSANKNLNNPALNPAGVVAPSGIPQEKPSVVSGNSTRSEKDYKEAIRALNSANDYYSLSVIKKKLEDLGDYKDSKAMLRECEARLGRIEKGWDIKKKAKIIIAISILSLILIGGTIYLAIDSKMKKNYKAAVKLYEERKIEEAYDKFEELDGYRDSEEYLERCDTYNELFNTAYYNQAFAYAELAEDRGAETDIRIEDDMEGFNNDYSNWRHRIVLDIILNYDSYEDYKKDYPGDKDVMNEWRGLADEFCDKLMSIYEEDKWESGSPKDDHLPIWQVNVKVRYMDVGQETYINPYSAWTEGSDHISHDSSEY